MVRIFGHSICKYDGPLGQPFRFFALTSKKLLAVTVNSMQYRYI